MHIALDIDGTITRCPGFFSVISQALIASGQRVSVLSFREDRGLAEEDLAECGIAYNELILPTQAEYQQIISHDWRQGAARWKADVCKRLKIDVMFDDMPEVISALGSETVGFLVVCESSLYVKDLTPPSIQSPKGRQINQTDRICSNTPEHL